MKVSTILRGRRVYTGETEEMSDYEKRINPMRAQGQGGLADYVANLAEPTSSELSQIKAELSPTKTPAEVFHPATLPKVEGAIKEILQDESAKLAGRTVMPSELSSTKNEVEGIKHDQTKEPLSLLSRAWLLGVASVMAFGARKYATHNWRGGIERSRLISAALRHILAYNEGEDKDQETGLSHLDHASCCLMFARELHDTRPDLDDRYKGGKK